MEVRHCEITGEAFSISDEEAQTYACFEIPLPTVCPQERCRRQLSFRNDQQFFWRKCSKTGKKMRSLYPNDAPFPVVCPEYWWSSECDNLAYGFDYDFSRLFIDQLQELWFKVPRPAQTLFQSINSRACTGSGDLANSFLLFNSWGAASCFYSAFLRDCEGCCDCYHLFSCAHCYESIHCRSCEKVRWAEFCQDCKDCYFISNCKNCSNCLFCTNLDGKQYYVLNKQVSVKEYERTVSDWTFTARPKVEMAKEQFDEFLAGYPIPHIFSDHPENNTGNYIRDCTFVYDCYECSSSNDLAHCHAMHDSRQCLDGFGFGGNTEQCVQFVQVGNGAKNVVNCIECWNNVSNLAYCSYCEDSSNLLGCVGLIGKNYCIFNKQYSREGYERLRSQIVDQLKSRKIWGKFFPASFSGFAYNQSSANLYMPMSKIPAKLIGYKWSEHDEYIRPSQLLGGGEQSPDERFAESPARLEDVDEVAISDNIYICELSGRPFRLTKDEVDIYQFLSVAPPARAFEQRQHERLMRIGPRSLGVRKSSLSGAKLKTSFPAHWRRPVIRFEEWQESTKD